MLSISASEVHVFDERGEDVRPDDAEVANLAEDTSNAFQWYSAPESTDSHDLAIIAQLETSNAAALPTKLSSPLGVGGLVRARIENNKRPVVANSVNHASQARHVYPAMASQTIRQRQLLG